MENHNTTSGAASVSAEKNERKSSVKFLGAIAVGCALGIILTGLIGWASMPSMMLTVHQSRYSTVEETCAALKEAIEANGWRCPAVRDMNASMAKEGVTMQRAVRLVELCKAGYANDVLASNPEVSTLMPCAWGVYEGADGKILISGMNMGLMGKMFWWPHRRNHGRRRRQRRTRNTQGDNRRGISGKQCRWRPRGVPGARKSPHIRKRSTMIECGRDPDWVRLSRRDWRMPPPHLPFGEAPAGHGVTGVPGVRKSATNGNAA